MHQRHKEDHNTNCLHPRHMANTTRYQGIFHSHHLRHILNLNTLPSVSLTSQHLSWLLFSVLCIKNIMGISRGAM